MSSDEKVVNDRGDAPRAVVPRKAAAGPPATAGSTQVPMPAATSDAESVAPAGANSRAEE